MKRRTLNLNHFTKTIPAKADGQNGTKEINASGVRLLVKESDDTFLLSLDDSPFIPIEAGLRIDITEDPEWQPGDIFKKITLQNDTAADINVTFYVFGPGIVDSRFNNLITRNTSVSVVSAPTRAVATVAPIGATTAIPGTNAGQDRQQISVYNPDFLVDLNVLKGADVFAVVYPRGSWTHPTSADLSIQNAGTANAIVGELYPV